LSQPTKQRLAVINGGANEVVGPVGYVLQGRLGDGAEGGAWQAQALASGATVVAKPVASGAEAAVRRTFDVLRQVGSPSLPTVRALAPCEQGAGWWLITDWVPGRPLAPGPAPLERALAEAAAIARGLVALHEAGTHHGDVSPANVVVEGEVRTLVDLAQLGRRGTGTPGFLAPEVLAGGGGPAADRFSLGAILVWRLTGELVWARPEALLSVRERADVALRLRALGLDALPHAVFDLLVRLLLPSADARPASTRAVARRLADLAASKREVVAGRLRWWPPSRWPYAGSSLEPATRGLADGSLRLVAVAGPDGAGRGRAAEELVLRLQARGCAASQEDAPTWVSAAGASSGSWIEAWAGRAPGDAVVGLSMPDVQVGDASRVRAASRLAGAGVVVVATAEAGDALENTPGVLVVRPRPLSRAEVRAFVAGGVEGSPADVERVGDTLFEVSGGWPASIVAAVAACARADASVAQVAAVAASAVEDVLEPGLALALLHAAWGEADPSLPPTLAPKGRPLRGATARARATLGASEVLRMARSAAGDGLAWAIDAQDDDALARCLDSAAPSDPELARAVASIQGRDVASGLLARAAALLLARGEAAEAERVAARAPADPACRFARARALQRLGKIDTALSLLRPEAGWAARGLRWRLLVDAGKAPDAAEEATRSAVDAAPLEGETEGEAVGLALALLWSAYAVALQGDVDTAAGRLSRVAAWAGGRTDVEAAAVAARVYQLQGNLAHGRGALDEAAAAFARAAEAFVVAGEPVGSLTLRGTSCALAVLTLDLGAGIEHGRAAVRGFLAQGQTSALVEAALNLVQLLARVGAGEEARAIGAAVDAAVGADAGALVEARRARLRADVLSAGARTAAERQRAAAAYGAAAASLEGVERTDEARDAWLRAALLLAVAGRSASIQRVLERAVSLAPSDDPAALAQLGASWVLATRGRPDALAPGLSWMRRAGSAASFLAAQRLDVALLFDRALLVAMRAQGVAPHRRHAVALRLLASLDLVMQKTRPNDKQAVRASLLAEGGDARALRELLEDLEAPAPSEAPPAAAPVVATTPAPSDGRYARLLRMYRRFAREDRLEPLLEQVVDAVMELTDAERGAVVVRRHGAEDLLVTRELSEGSEGASYSRSVIAKVLESGEPVLSVDAAADERFDDSRSISHLNLRSVLAVPLRFRGQLLGAAYVDHRLRRGNFGEDDLAHMEAFSDLAALAVAHAAALSDLEQKTHALTTSSEQLAELLEQREAEVLALRENARRTTVPSEGYRGIIGGSSGMQAVFRLIDRVADADVPVVVHGESGTGKELVARALHDAGGRAQGPFVAENCGAIPETLLESVLFGHAKGAFTGAQKAKPGLFEAADTGTIFLDEVSEMSMPMQTKLLRVLQEGEVRRVGETSARSVDVRVVAASNRDLEAMVEDGSFRRDLFYRINVVRIELPPLRERPEDIAPLIEHFFARHRAAPLRLAPSVLRALRGFAWPGNVRQLENEVQRWIALCEGGVGLEDLSPSIVGTAEPEAIDPDDLRIRPRVDRLERGLIARALEKTGNNQTQAALLLGLSRYGLQKKLKRLDAEAHQG
jgi:transcriptional regulator with GAF, ATPase, and Fis domain/tetratricopeptide (TPR) repeat protein